MHELVLILKFIASKLVPCSNKEIIHAFATGIINIIKENNNGNTIIYATNFNMEILIEKYNITI